MRKSSTNQLTVLNALASFLYNSMLEKLRATMGYYSLNTPVMLSSQTSTRCYLWSSFTSLLIFTWWILFFFFTLFYFTILYWFWHTLTWIRHGCTWAPKHEPLPLPPPTPRHLSGSSPCTSPKHPPSCIEHRLAIRFLHDSIHVSVPFSQIISPSPSPSETYLNINLQFSFHIFVSLFSSCTFYWPLKILKENPWLCACCASWIKGVENRSPVTHPPKTKSWPSAAAAAQGTPSRWTRFLF